MYRFLCEHSFHFFKYPGMGLLGYMVGVFFFFLIFQMWWVYFTLMQNQRFLLLYRDQYITRSWKIGVGHAGHDGQLLCNMTLHHHWRTHWKEQWGTELKCGWTWQPPGMPLSTSLKMDSVPELQWGLDYRRITILWKNKKFTPSKFKVKT